MTSNNLEEKIYDNFLIYIHDYMMMQHSNMIYFFCTGLINKAYVFNRVMAWTFLMILFLGILLGFYSEIITISFVISMFGYLTFKMVCLGWKHYNLLKTTTLMNANDLDYGLFYKIMKCFTLKKFGSEEDKDILQKLKTILNDGTLTLKMLEDLKKKEGLIFIAIIASLTIVFLMLFSFIESSVMFLTVSFAGMVLVFSYKVWNLKNGIVYATVGFLSMFVLLVFCAFFSILGNALTFIICSIYESFLLIIAIYALMSKNEIVYGMVHESKKELCEFYKYFAICIAVNIFAKGIVRILKASIKRNKRKT